MWIVIVDQNETTGRRIFLLTDGDGNAARFDIVKEIEKLKYEHLLGSFDWWAFNIHSGNAVIVG